MKSKIFGFYDPFTDMRKLRENAEKTINTLWGICIDKQMFDVIVEGTVCEGILSVCAYELDVDYTKSDEIHNFVALVKNLNKEEENSTENKTLLN